MKQKQKRELERVYAVSDLAAKQHDAKIQQWKDRFAQLRDDVAKEKESWILKYNNLEHLLTLSKDRLYSEKAKCRTLVQRQIDEAKRVEIMLKNYSESLEEENVELRHELGTAIKEKRKAEQASHKSTQLAKDRLQKWHAEKQLRREAEDYVAKQEKSRIQLQDIVNNYKQMLTNSQETQRKKIRNSY